MYRCSRGPLVASVCFLITGSIALAQGNGGLLECLNECQEACRAQAAEACALAEEESQLTECVKSGLAMHVSCNEELADVVGFVPTIYGLNENLECVVVRAGTVTAGRRLCTPNLAVAAILSQLDIDGDGIPDNSPDTDGDGLPDNWELGGLEAPTAQGEEIDRVVFYPAPTAIVPGTPPTPIFTRLAVATSALDPDTDDDGLTDFIEVFGLMFIDENRNGLLDASPALIRQASDGSTVDGREWNDLNIDGLPSPGEHPIFNAANDAAKTQLGQLHDFDGFVFTDPTNGDTDGDGVPDGQDKDPLINPRAFGNTGSIIVVYNAEGNDDVDQDGLGNGMDMGNDLTSADGPGVRDFERIDNPESIGDLLSFFRADLLAEIPPVLPESASEDLLGADWDGNGLWRSTDVRTWHIVIADPVTDPGSAFLPPDDLFDVAGHKLYAPQSLAQLQAIVNHPDYKVYAGDVSGLGVLSGNRNRIGMGWQDLLAPSGTTQFIPDKRVWAILYSWRMPGFDIDGDGFVGVPNIPATFSPSENVFSAMLLLNTAGRYELVEGSKGPGTYRPFDDRIELGSTASTSDGLQLDGIIVAPPGFAICGTFGMGTILLLLVALAAPRYFRRK